MHKTLQLRESGLHRPTQGCQGPASVLLPPSGRVRTEGIRLRETLLPSRVGGSCCALRTRSHHSLSHCNAQPARPRDWLEGGSPTGPETAWKTSSWKAAPGTAPSTRRHSGHRTNKCLALAGGQCCGRPGPGQNPKEKHLKLASSSMNPNRVDRLGPGEQICPNWSPSHTLACSLLGWTQPFPGTFRAVPLSGQLCPHSLRQPHGCGTSQA